jgi:RloB-like protein
MRRRHTQIPPRRRVFLGCEGESERGYARVLQSFLEESGLHVRLLPVTLEPGGDPLALIERAKRRIEEGQRNQDGYEQHAVLLDADRLGQKRDRDIRMRALAKSQRIELLWQDPCHEALLLRHLPGCAQRRPPQSAEALAELRRHWPAYEKGLSAQEIQKQIGGQQIRQAMTVEPQLRAFLNSLGIR